MSGEGVAPNTTIGRMYPGRSHIEAIRRELTRLEFVLMGDGISDTQNYSPDPITCHRMLGNIVAQADAITIVVEDLGK